MEMCIPAGVFPLLITCSIVSLYFSGFNSLYFSSNLRGYFPYISLFVCVVSVFPVPFYFSLSLFRNLFYLCNYKLASAMTVPYYNCSSFFINSSTIFNAVSLIKPPHPCPAFFSLTNSTSLSICFSASYKMQD